MQPGQVGGIKGAWLRLTKGAYKTACKKAITLRKGMKASGQALFRELTEANETQEKWQQWSGTGAMPKAVSEAAFATKFIRPHRRTFVRSKLSAKGTGIDWISATLVARCSALASDNATPYRIRRLYEIEQELFSLGVQRLVDEIRSTRKPADPVEPPVPTRVDQIDSGLGQRSMTRAFAGFVGSTHDGYVDDFKRLDSTG